jgi:N-acetylneuraminic acid mutarotase
VKLLIALSFSFFTFVAQAEGWLQKSSIGGYSRTGAFSFSIGGKGYVGGGYDSVGISHRDFWEYDPSNDSWTRKADLPGPERCMAFACAIGNKGYVGGGSQSFFATNLLHDFWQYDPSTNAWTPRANFGGGNRCWASAFSINDKGYVCTGWDSAYHFCSDVWEYNSSTNAWTQKANFGGGFRTSTSAFAIGGYGYVGAGFYSGPPVGDFWRYDPQNNLWTSIASLPSVRNDAFSFTINGKGYVSTGEAVTFPTVSYLNDLWQYNPATNQWLQKLNFAGSSRDEASGFVIGCKAYLGFGGENSNPCFGDFWEYTPDTIDCFLSVDELNNNLFRVFPNPSNGNIIIEGKGLVEIYNLRTEKIYSERLNGEPIYLNQPPGIYFVKVSDEDGVYTQKLVIQ